VVCVCVCVCIGCIGGIGFKGGIHTYTHTHIHKYTHTHTYLHLLEKQLGLVCHRMRGNKEMRVYMVYSIKAGFYMGMGFIAHTT
jgi:hypothetical protein